MARIRMKDIRTPNTYYQTGEERKLELETLKAKLDDLLVAVQKLKGKASNTPATEKIVDNEITRLQKARYKKNSMDRAKKFVDEMVDGTPNTAVALLMDCLDYKAFVRSEPHLQNTGKRMEEQVFGD